MLLLPGTKSDGAEDDLSTLAILDEVVVEPDARPAMIEPTDVVPLVRLDVLHPLVFLPEQEARFLLVLGRDEQIRLAGLLNLHAHRWHLEPPQWPPLASSRARRGCSCPSLGRRGRGYALVPVGRTVVLPRRS